MISCDIVLYSINRNSFHYEFCFNYHREQMHNDKVRSVLLSVALFF